MRKRRRLADKLTIMVCAVLVAVSAFFYAPMDVEASSVYDSSYSFIDSKAYSLRDGELCNMYVQQNGVPITGSFETGVYYRLQGNFSVDVSSSRPFSPRVFIYRYNFNLPPVFYVGVNDDNEYLNYSRDFGFDFIISGSYLNTSFVNALNMYFFGEYGVYSFDVDTNITINSITPLTGTDSASYERGYDAGYSVGVQVGESNGYSNGYSDGFEAGEQSGYDSGFQAGQDSVDTQSYYDIGYSAGYDAGYLSGYDDGYDDGYDAGWSAFEAQMDKWGADTTDYPKQVISQDYTSTFCQVIVSGTTTTALPYYGYSNWDIAGVNFNPNHTYKIRVVLNDDSYDIPSAVFSALKNNYYLDIGGSKYALKANSYGTENYFYVPGDRMSNILKFVWEPYFYTLSGNNYLCTANLFLAFTVYDMGPIGDTQNHIANQTDQLTGGYNDSQGNSVNNDFSSGLNEFETAEDSLFATATTGLKDFTFFDIQSVPAMVTGMSFVGSIMSGWFTQAGGASGVGIVLSILFSIMLVAMVLGLYRWYQSKGGKD